MTVEGKQWLSYAQAQSQGFALTGGTTGTASLTPSPATDAATASMLNSYLVGTSDLGTMTLTQTVAGGTYQVHLWFMETVQPNSHRFHVGLEGTQVVSNIGDLSIGQWRKYGPYTVTVSDGVLTVDLVAPTAGRCCRASPSPRSEFCQKCRWLPRFVGHHRFRPFAVQSPLAAWDRW